MIADHGFPKRVITDPKRAITMPECMITGPKRVITSPERKPGFGLAVVLRMYSTAALACSLFYGRRADADTSDEHAQIEGSPATEVGVWPDASSDQPGHRHQRRGCVEVRNLGRPGGTRLGRCCLHRSVRLRFLRHAVHSGRPVRDRLWMRCTRG